MLVFGTMGVRHRRENIENPKTNAPLATRYILGLMHNRTITAEFRHWLSTHQFQPLPGLLASHDGTVIEISKLEKRRLKPHRQHCCLFQLESTSPVPRHEWIRYTTHLNEKCNRQQVCDLLPTNNVHAPHLSHVLEEERLRPWGEPFMAVLHVGTTQT